MKKHITPKAKGVLPIENEELKNKVCILDAKVLKPQYREAKYQLWKAIDGFGTNPMCAGRAVFGVALLDGEKTRWSRDNFIGIASEELIKQYFPEYKEELVVS